MTYYGFEIIEDRRVRPGAFRVIQIWLGRIDWRWPKRRQAPGPRRPFNHDQDRWAW